MTAGRQERSKIVPFAYFKVIEETKEINCRNVKRSATINIKLRNANTGYLMAIADLAIKLLKSIFFILLLLVSFRTWL